MKRNILSCICLCAILLTVTSCFKKDDYAAPGETLTGTIIDSVSGAPIQTEQGSGIRLKLDDLSWNDNPVPLYFWVKQDGTFNNTKLFAGQYRVTPVDGPFVPLVQYDEDGKIVEDNSKTVQVKGVTNVSFTVQPFLEVSWMGDPVVNADSTVTVQVKFSRGTSDPAYQFDVTDVYLFVSEAPYVGNNDFDNRYSKQISYSGTAGNDEIGKTISITTSKMPGNRSYYIRVGARTADNVQKRYNYTDIKTISVP